MTLPAASPADERPALPGPGDQDRTHVLVVDDLPENRLVYRTVLEELGQHVVTAASGSEALRHVLHTDFAVVLLDVNMPEMDGFETATLIRGRRRSAHVPIIFLTALPDEMRGREAYAHGAVDYILTPVVPEVLRAKVRVFVELAVMSAREKRRAEERLALAHERSRRAAAEESIRRLEVLVEAGARVGRSLEVEATARDTAAVCVPFLSDEAAVVIPAAPDLPGYVLLARPAADPPESAGTEAAHVVSVAEVDALPRAMAAAARRVAPGDDGAGARLAADASGRDEQAFALPLESGGRPFGVLVLSRAVSGRAFGTADRSMARVIASRCSSALLNACLYADVKQADRRKDEFLAMLGHELRNPLGPIRNAVEILRLRGEQDAILRKAEDIIDRQATHMAHLIDDLLDATRIARGKVLLRLERCDLVSIVRLAAEDYRPVLERAGLLLDLELPSHPVWVHGDPTRLAQIVGNLLHNAQKFTERGGRAALRLVVRGDDVVEVRVTDSGIGITPELLPRVFEVFSQGDHGLDRSRGGLGLGLALVKGLVELHGGRALAESDGVGHGATFVLELPLAEPLDAPAPAARDGAARVAACRILIVEDNADAAESTRMLLQMEGHEVATAFAGDEALRRAVDFRPDVVLCDIGLPGELDGYGVARALRRTPGASDAYLVAVSGYGRDEDRLRAREAGFDLHLTKPIAHERLRAALAPRRAALARDAGCDAREGARDDELGGQCGGERGAGGATSGAGRAGPRRVERAGPSGAAAPP